ncbi:MAG: hypothetical protein ABI586_04030 [Candidatus Nanopelagicales bacterium]
MLTVHIRKRDAAALEWLATYGHERVAGGTETSLADCLRSAADVLFPLAERLECRITYQERVAGPYPVSRLLLADELADHLAELARER